MFYTQRADGTWITLVSATQCPIMVDCISREVRCQGIAGHSGNCWAFSSNGAFLQRKRLESIDDNGDDGWSSTTPPGHQNYPDVLAKYLESAQQNSRFEVVTDDEVLKSLKGDTCDE